MTKALDCAAYQSRTVKIQTPGGLTLSIPEDYAPKAGDGITGSADNYARHLAKLTGLPVTVETLDVVTFKP